MVEGSTAEVYDLDGPWCDVWSLGVIILRFCLGSLLVDDITEVLRYIGVLYSLFLSTTTWYVQFCLSHSIYFHFKSSNSIPIFHVLPFHPCFASSELVDECGQGWGLPLDGCGHGWRVWLIEGGCGDGCGDWRMWGGLWMPMVRDGSGQE